MSQISILQGIYSNSQAATVDALPINLEPTIVETGLSKGYLSNTPGITLFSDEGLGRDRCAIVWNDTQYRIQGSKLISVSNTGHTIIIGDVGDDGKPAFMDYGFDRLAIASNGFLWYLRDNGSFYQVTDPLAINVLTITWVDGYFMFTDGSNLVVTSLADPDVILPFNYGTAEIDPDPILNTVKLYDEIYALGQYTIQNFQNIGGDKFPFATNDSAFIPKGVIGSRAFTVFSDGERDYLAFVGSGKNEDISIYIATSGSTKAIVSNAISNILQSMSSSDQELIELETIVTSNEFRLLVHLPDQTLVYYYIASQAAESPIWTIHKGGILLDQAYPIRHFVYINNKFIGANSSSGLMGYLDYSVTTHFGESVGWQFQTIYIYNQGGFTINSIELVATTGRTPLGDDPTIFFSYSRDGIYFSQERAIKQGKLGETVKKLAWRPMCNSYNYMNLRFRGANTAIASIMRLEAAIEGDNL